MNDIQTMANDNTPSKKAAWFLLATIALLYFFSNLQKVLVPGATFDVLQQLFPDADGGQITRLGAAFMYPYAFMQLLTGLLADRYSGVRVLFVGAFLFCLGAICSAFPGSLTLLFVSRMLTGCGAATIYLSAAKEISRQAGEALALCIGALTLIGYSGAITGTTPFAIGLSHFGYSGVMLGIGLALGLAYLLFLVSAAFISRAPVCRDVTFRPRSYLDVLKISANNWVCVLNGCSFGVFFALQSIIGKKYLEDFCHMTHEGASVVLLMTMVIAAVNGFLAATVSRFIGDRRKPFFYFSGVGSLLSLSLLIAATLVGFRAPWFSILAMVILAFSANLGSIMVACLKDANDANHFGIAMSVANFIPYLVTAILGEVSGRILEIFPPTLVDGVKIYGQSSYLLFFALLLPAGVGALVTAIMIRETNPGKAS